MTQTLRLILGDCTTVLRGLQDSQVGAIVTDPPYGLEFMGKDWDAPWKETGKETPQTTDPKVLFQEWCVIWLRECYRVLVPGGRIKVFGGTRMKHRMEAAVEQAGFILLAEEAWGYGCLSEDTEILTQAGWVPYHSAKVGTLVLGFDLGTGGLSWQPVEETYAYDYDREAFHIVGDGTDQVVSVGHRCVVQRDGKWVFVQAQDLTGTEVVPGVRAGVHPEAGGATGVQYPMPHGTESDGAVRPLYGLRDSEVVSRCLAEKDGATSLFQAVQRGASGTGVGEARAQGCCRGDTGGTCLCREEDDRSAQPGLEGWGDVLPQARELRQERTDSVHSVSSGVPVDGPEGRVCDGAPSGRGASAGSSVDPVGDGASPESQPGGQQVGESGAVRVEPGAQAVRASRVTSAYLAGIAARVERIPYRGVVWCVRVATGAFVARRNGLAFITGNSGFPKSLNLSKAIDKSQGKSDEREVVGYSDGVSVEDSQGFGGIGRGAVGIVQKHALIPVTASATSEAARFEGYGTALKPAWEPFVVGMKP